MTHTCITKLTIIGSDNGLSPGRRQAIVWTNAGILLICCLTAPSHCLNQCWLIISEAPVTFILRQFHKRSLNHKFQTKFPGANELIKRSIKYLTLCWQRQCGTCGMETIVGITLLESIHLCEETINSFEDWVPVKTKSTGTFSWLNRVLTAIVMASRWYTKLRCYYSESTQKVYIQGHFQFVPKMLQWRFQQFLKAKNKRISKLHTAGLVTLDSSVQRAVMRNFFYLAWRVHENFTAIVTFVQPHEMQTS